MKKGKLNKRNVEEALREMSGNIAAAARKLGVARLSIYRFIEKNPSLVDVVNDYRQAMADNAESALNRAVINGEAWAVCFTLKTIGKTRGYVERMQQEVTGRDGQPLEVKSTVTVYDHSAAIASIASRSATDYRAPGTD